MNLAYFVIFAKKIAETFGEFIEKNYLCNVNEVFSKHKHISFFSG